jgi:chemotaxis protein histidine kinase CheA
MLTQLLRTFRRGLKIIDKGVHELPQGLGPMLASTYVMGDPKQHATGKKRIPDGEGVPDRRIVIFDGQGNGPGGAPLLHQPAAGGEEPTNADDSIINELEANADNNSIRDLEADSDRRVEGEPHPNPDNGKDMLVHWQWKISYTQTQLSNAQAEQNAMWWQVWRVVNKALVQQKIELYQENLKNYRDAEEHILKLIQEHADIQQQAEEQTKTKITAVIAELREGDSHQKDIARMLNDSLTAAQSSDGDFMTVMLKEFAAESVALKRQIAHLNQNMDQLRKELAEATVKADKATAEAAKANAEAAETRRLMEESHQLSIRLQEKIAQNESQHKAEMNEMERRLKHEVSVTVQTLTAQLNNRVGSPAASTYSLPTLEDHNGFTESPVLTACPLRAGQRNLSYVSLHSSVSSLDSEGWGVMLENPESLQEILRNQNQRQNATQSQRGTGQ